MIKRDTGSLDYSSYLGLSATTQLSQDVSSKPLSLIHDLGDQEELKRKSDSGMYDEHRTLKSRVHRAQKGIQCD